MAKRTGLSRRLTASTSAGAAMGRRDRAGRRPLAAMEMLESRVLLSASHITWNPTASTTKSGVTLSVKGNSLTATGGFTPDQIRQAYGISSLSYDGTGQTIAIIDAYNDPTIAADLQTFSTQFGLAAPNLTVLNQSGGTALPGTDPAGRGDSWAAETALDVEWAHAIAPGAKIVLFEASSESNSDLEAAVRSARSYPGVSVVSMSFGSAEAFSDKASDSLFTTPTGHTGITFVASAGDNGAYGDGGFAKAAEAPATSPNVLAVGGTSLTVDSSGNYLSESGWGSGTTSGINGGSGGGISKYESQPAYQQGVVTQSTTRRTVPDVSIVADPSTGVETVDSWDTPGSPWTVVGGTSLSAPIWAGLIALANQGRVAASEATFRGTEAMTALYALPSADFHDVTTGNNGYSAGAGYDLVTGLGTPVANRLIPDLVAASTSTIVTPTGTDGPTIGALAVTPGVAAAGTKLTFRATGVTGVDKSITSVQIYEDTDGTAGISATTDSLVGTAKRQGKTNTWVLTTKLTASVGGDVTFAAIATDSTGAVSDAASTSLTVSAPTISDFTVSPDAVSTAGSISLTASGVTESPGKVKTVLFYRESNGVTGLQVDSDTLVGSAKKRGNNWTLTVSAADLTTGAYTFYAVAKDTGAVSSDVLSAALSVVAQPANDLLANATVLSGSTLSLTATNGGASKETKEVKIAGNAGGASVWWSWTAPASGTATISTEGSDFDTELGVYTGDTVAKLKTVAANDDQSDVDVTSAVTFNAVEGTTYLIGVDGFDGDTGTIELALTLS